MIKTGIFPNSKKNVKVDGEEGPMEKIHLHKTNCDAYIFPHNISPPSTSCIEWVLDSGSRSRIDCHASY